MFASEHTAPSQTTRSVRPGKGVRAVVSRLLMVLAMVALVMLAVILHAQAAYAKPLFEPSPCRCTTMDKTSQAKEEQVREFLRASGFYIQENHAQNTEAGMRSRRHKAIQFCCSSRGVSGIGVM